MTIQRSIELLLEMKSRYGDIEVVFDCGHCKKITRPNILVAEANFKETAWRYRRQKMQLVPSITVEVKNGWFSIHEFRSRQNEKSFSFELSNPNGIEMLYISETELRELVDAMVKYLHSLDQNKEIEDVKK